MLDLHIDVSQLQRGMASCIDRHPRAQSAALNRCATIVTQAVRRQDGKTYARKIPISRSGRPKWVRNGNFQRSPVAVNSSPSERIITRQGPAASPITNYPGGYAQRLANIPTGPDGINRSNPSLQEAHRITEPQIGPAFESEYRANMGL